MSCCERVRRKLATAEDSLHVHKVLGALAVVHFAYRYLWVWPRTGSLGFDATDSDDSSANFELFNAACMALGEYLSVPDFMRQAMHDFGMADPSMKGIYGG